MRQLAYGSIIQISMQNSSHKSSPRPFVYRTKADIQQFVMGNASQAYSVNLPFEPPRTAPNFHPASSLFDRYNRNNLLLRECDAKDVTTLHKNLIMAEQPLSRETVEEVSQKVKQKQRELAATGQQLLQHEYPSAQFLRTAPAPSHSAPSREYQQNEILFNYHEMGQAKKEKKLQFLEQIEARIAEAEREIQGLEELQEEERAEMNELARTQQRVGEQLSRQAEANKVSHQVVAAIGLEIEPRQQLASIHAQMQPREINQVLEEHITANEQLLRLAGSLARGRSKEKVKAEKTGTSFNNTQWTKQQKSLTSTAKAGFKPPKFKAK